MSRVIKGRKKRDPDATREAILEAARTVLAQDGSEGLSVAQVAKQAGVNRGTAYRHFQTREQLIEATAAWVSDSLYRSVFGEWPAESDDTTGMMPADVLTERLVTFAMENPELGRVWLFELLRSQRPANDQFWRHYLLNFAKFAETEFAEPGIDVEVVAVFMLVGTFLWPVWAGAHGRTSKERRQLAKRFSREVLRMSLHGTICLLEPGAMEPIGHGGSLPRPEIVGGGLSG